MYLVLDLETVADSNLWKPTQPKKGSRAKAPEDQFPPLYAHRPIAIGYALFDDKLALVPGHLGVVGHDNEPELLTQFSTWLTSLDATLVTWNGRGFDLPVLSLRSFRHGLQLKWNTSNHRKRYSEDPHLDLLGALTDWGPRISGYSLDAFCSVIGLPGKGEVQGKTIAALYEKGELSKIYGYCTCDVARTSFLLFRYLLMRGRIDVDTYRTAAAAFYQLCVERHLDGVLFGADPRTLLLQDVPGAAPTTTAQAVAP